MELQWDAANIKHIIHDYPDRDNSTSEVESVFADPYVQISASKPDRRTGEERFQAVGLSNRFRVCSVVFVFRNEQIRPISCWPSKAKIRNIYAQNVQEKQQEDGGSHQE